jgi:hypothetical protein
MPKYMSMWGDLSDLATNIPIDDVNIFDILDQIKQRHNKIGWTVPINWILEDAAHAINDYNHKKRLDTIITDYKSEVIPKSDLEPEQKTVLITKKNIGTQLNFNFDI